MVYILDYKCLLFSIFENELNIETVSNELHLHCSFECRRNVLIAFDLVTYFEVVINHLLQQPLVHQLSRIYSLQECSQNCYARYFVAELIYHYQLKKYICNSYYVFYKHFLVDLKRTLDIWNGKLVHRKQLNINYQKMHLAFCNLNNWSTDFSSSSHKPK